MEQETTGAQELYGLERKLDQTKTANVRKNKSFWEEVGNGLSWLSEQYFRPKSFEKSGKIYEMLGVRTFKKFLPTFGDYVCRLTGHKWIDGRKDLDGVEFWTRVWEAMHIPVLVITTPFIVDQLSEGRYGQAAINIGLNTLINVYPIMTQRYNRARIYRALGK